MIKRRSFLAMLGLAPMAAVTKAVPEPLAAPVAPAIETAAEGVVMANVRMPVRVSLTAEQVQIAESWRQAPDGIKAGRQDRSAS